MSLLQVQVLSLAGNNLLSAIVPACDKVRDLECEVEKATKAEFPLVIVRGSEVLPSKASLGQVLKDFHGPLTAVARSSAAATERFSLQLHSAQDVEKLCSSLRCNYVPGPRLMLMCSGTEITGVRGYVGNPRVGARLWSPELLGQDLDEVRASLLASVARNHEAWGVPCFFQRS
jgi:hypothetical protein